MRKIALVLTLALATLGTRAQQKNFVPEAVFGIKAGMVGSNVQFLPEVGQKMSVHTNAGIMARYVAEKHLGIQGEVNFSQRGWKEDNELGFKYKRTLSYIEVPVLAHIYFGRRLRFFVNAGPEFGYMISDKASAENLPDPDPNHQHKPSPDHKFDYGICLGAGGELRMQRVRMAVEGRYYFGLADLFKNGTQNHFDRSSNRFFSVSLLLMADMKKRSAD